MNQSLRRKCRDLAISVNILDAVLCVTPLTAAAQDALAALLDDLHTRLESGMEASGKDPDPQRMTRRASLLDAG
jgi:hypothetical protein